MKALQLGGHTMRSAVLLLCASPFFAGAAAGQNAIQIEPPKGGLGWLTHPYQTREVPPINLTNTPRLDALIHAGNLYLTAQDVVALAIENNLDIEVQRSATRPCWLTKFCGAPRAAACYGPLVSASQPVPPALA
jgi:hypothetical protein